MNYTLLLFILFAVFITLNVPIAISLGASALIVGLLMGESLSFAASIMFAAILKIELLAIPFFIMAGYVMDRCGIMDRLFRLIDYIIGPIRGGTAMVTSSVAVLFGGISGSGPADTAALASSLAPVMKDRGYAKPFSAALISAGGSLGLIVPPSIAFILYGVVVPGISIGKMFMAGILPGIMMGIVLAITGYVISKKRGYGFEDRQTRGSLRQVLKALKDSAWGLLAPAVIIGGIYLGVFTPTEAAGVAVLYGIAVGFFIYKEIGVKELLHLAKQTAIDSAVIMLIISGASLFSWILTVDGTIPDLVVALSDRINTNWQVFIFSGLVLLIAGMFIDGASIYLVLVPLLMPTVRAQGIDLIWYGVFIAIVIAIGQFTPPVGVNLFVASRIVDVDFSEICKDIWPVLLASLFCLLLIVLFPFLSTWLPSTMSVR